MRKIIYSALLSFLLIFGIFSAPEKVFAYDFTISNFSSNFLTKFYTDESHFGWNCNPYIYDPLSWTSSNQFDLGRTTYIEIDGGTPVQRIASGGNVSAICPSSPFGFTGPWYDFANNGIAQIDSLLDEFFPGVDKTKGHTFKYFFSKLSGDTENPYIQVDLNGGYDGTPPNCFDGIQNQDETGVDVGGICVNFIYSSKNSDASEQISSSSNFLIQTLGTRLEGTLARIDVQTSNSAFDFYTSQPIVNLYECDDSNYGNPSMDGFGCLLLYSGTSNDISQSTKSVQSFYIHDSITFNPLKYYLLTARGTNNVNVLPIYYGSSTDTVEGGCYQRKATTVPCTTIADLYFDLHGVTKSVAPVCTTDCYSNVLFLPGLKGSVLEKGTDQLWPPTVFSNDISQLALTQDGESVNDIHTSGILNKFYTKDIYLPFSNFMDSISGDDKLIKKWLPLAYDWRFSPEKILIDGIKTETDTLDIVEEIEKLAEDSRTGKITIVAHSMGGLLGKAIIKKLQEEGKDELIDSFVMIGTPQLGTPQAIASILHGDSEGIVAGFIVNPIDIRRIAQNMPSAYNLLPSPRYFNDISDPVIKFNTDALFTQAWRNFWGLSINTYSNFLSFMTGTGVTRTKPVDTILRDPEVLRYDLVANASNFHNQYDDYQIPDHIRVVQVAGWGSPTVKAVEYKISHGIPNYETLFTREGDRTVVYPSAISSVADETYFFNIFDYNDFNRTGIQHRDLLNASSTQNFIESLIKKEDILENSFISDTKPPLDDLDDQLVVSTHSPVLLGVHDQLGNFTGINSNQDLSADILAISENIPGSAFVYSSDSQHIFLPKEGAYNFVYKGTGSGPATVTIESFVADVATRVALYTDIPTTSSTTATFSVQSTTPEDTRIVLDTNSDGKAEDVIVADGAELSLNELISLIKQKISVLVVSEKPKQNLLKQISNLEKKIESKKQKNLKILADLKKKISNQEMKGRINTADATEITNLLDVLEAQAEDIALDPVVLANLKTKIQSLNIKNNLKNDLLKRVESLKKKQMIIKTLSNVSKNIAYKAKKGKISDVDAQVLVDILHQIEDVI